MKKYFEWKLVHPAHGELCVIASTKLEAIEKAGVAWKTTWTSLAKDFIYQRPGAISIIGEYPGGRAAVNK